MSPQRERQKTFFAAGRVTDPNIIYPGSDLTNVFPEEGADMTNAEQPSIAENCTFSNSYPITLENGKLVCDGWVQALRDMGYAIVPVNAPTQAQIEAARGLVERLRTLSVDYAVQEGGFTDDGQIINDAADTIIALSAAAEVGEPSLSRLPPEEQRKAHEWMDKQLAVATIKRCAQVARGYLRKHAGENIQQAIASEILALKDKP